MKQFFSTEYLTNIGILVLRYGMSVVFLWFGFSQLHNPSQWVAFLPEWVSLLPVSQTSFVMSNGLFEVVGAFLLLVGVYTRIVALLLGLHLFMIAASIGITSTGVRDFGLAIASLAIAFFGAGKFSIDSFSEEERSIGVST